MSRTPVSAEGDLELGRCEMRLSGQLDDRWDDWFESLTFM